MADLSALRRRLLERRVPLDHVLRQAVDQVTAALRADRGTLYLLDHARGELVSRAAILPELREIRLALGEGVAGHVASRDVVVNVPLGTRHARFADHIDQATGYRTRSLLAAPVHDHDGTVIGVLQVLNRRTPDGQGLADGFDSACERLLLDLAAQIAELLAASSLASQLRPDQSRALDFHFNGIVGSSPGMRELTRRLALVAPTPTTVLILGETGTGKALVARAVHDSSPRAEGPFEAVDCAALPGSLVENELFGHLKGAYTGAHSDAPGRIALAQGGTLFLDEIGELPLTVQAKLLRVLQDRRWRPIGGGPERVADVRIVAATHCDLRDMVAQGSFREDLYYRLSVVELHVPPLRERGAADLDRLIDHFREQQARRLERPVELSPPARRALHEHDWPGNVRELEHAVEAAAVLSGGEAIRAELLDLGRRSRHSQPPGSRFTTALRPLQQVERDYVRWALEQHEGNKSATARALHIGRNTLARKLSD